eukprot:Nitzschia sp. Nitz4//scaffold13_size275219//199216//200163//NITZ4_000899-RA/size275219-processed-gene-0.158-mRNA-1//-1//CDS//3329536089//8090//frame0
MTSYYSTGRRTTFFLAILSWLAMQWMGLDLPDFLMAPCVVTAFVPINLPATKAWTTSYDPILSQVQCGPSSKLTSLRVTNLPEDWPTPPKRPVTPYILFCNEKRKVISQSGKSFAAVSKELSEMWKSLPDSLRSRYEQQFETNKREYEDKKRAWMVECKETMGRYPPNLRNKKLHSVKRPKSAYLFFCNEQRPLIWKKHNHVSTCSKELAELWSKLTPGQREVYDKMAQEDKVRYQKEVEEHPVTPIVKKRKRKISAYQLFCRKTRDSLVDEKGEKLSLPQAASRLSQLWKKCDESTKLSLAQECLRLNEQERSS